MPSKSAPTRKATPSRKSGDGEQSHSAVYAQVRGSILSGTLRPMERITENQVAERFGLSRTPVREAFRRLAAEGLIVVVPQRGAFVSRPSVEDILEIYQIRTPLECMATRVAAETITEEQLRRLEELVEAERDRGERRSPDRSLRLNREFHGIIIGCTRNQRLASFLLEMQHQVHRSRVLWPSTVTRLDETWKEHAAIVTALRTHDPAAAERGMREHLERARASTVNRILPSSSGLVGGT